MAIYVADLRSTSGWTERWNTGYASVSTTTDGFRVSQTSHGDYGYSWNTIDSDSGRDNSEILIKVKFTNRTSSGTSFGVGCFCRGSGAAGSEALISSHLYINNTTGYGSFTMSLTGGSYSDVIAATAFAIDPATWYWIKLRVNSTSVKAKVWKDGTAEPAWQVDTTESTVSAAGWVGIYSNNATCDPYDIGYFAVATNGDSLSSGAGAGFFLGADF